VADTKLTRAEVAKQLAGALKEKLVKFENDVQELKAREGSTKTRKLEKHELCPICGGPDINAVCDCLKKNELQKNALMGYGPGSPGAGTPSSTGMGSMGGGGTQPMGLSEFSKMELCKDCGMDHAPYEPHKMKKDAAGMSDVGSLSKKAPPGEEKLVHKLKDEYGHDEEGKRKAFATAWAIKNKTVEHKAEESMEKHQMASSSAAALAPPAAKPATPVGQANKEMGGFTSLASNPIHSASMGGGGMKTPAAMSPKAPRPHIPSMGRPAGTGFSVKMGGVEGGRGGSVAGTIPNAKSEIGSSGGPGHASDKSYPSAIKENLGATAKAEMSTKYAAKVGVTDHRNKAKAAYGDGPHDQRPGMHQAHMGVMNSASPEPPKVRKDEKEMKRVVAAPEKAAPETKMPESGKSVDAKKPGSGGEIKKGKALRKDAMSPSYAKKVGMDIKGVGGKQPVGQGGGDAKPSMPAMKPMNAQLPKPAGSKSNINQKDSPLKAAGRSEVKRMISDAGPAGNPNTKELPAEDVDVSEFNAGPNRLAPGRTNTAAVGNPAALQGVRDQMNLAADKKAGGIGFLRGLVQRFSRGPKANPAVDAAVAQMKQAGMGQRGTTIPTDSTGGVRTVPAGTPTGPVKSTRFHGALPLQRGEKPMKKGALALSEMGSCALCGHPEHPGLCKGVMSSNHSRSMLSVKKTRGKKSR